MIRYIQSKKTVSKQKSPIVKGNKNKIINEMFKFSKNEVELIPKIE